MKALYERVRGLVGRLEGLKQYCNEVQNQKWEARAALKDGGTDEERDQAWKEYYEERDKTAEVQKLYNEMDYMVSRMETMAHYAARLRNDGSLDEFRKEMRREFYNMHYNQMCNWL